MKKVLRFLLIGTGILAAFVAVIFVLTLLPAVQTWAAKQVIASNPSLGISHLGRVSVGFQRIEVSDVTVARPGLALTLPSAVIELPLIAAARGDIQLRRLVAKGWTLDLAAPHPPAVNAASVVAHSQAASVPTPFEGVFKLLELPADIAVESAELEGVVIFSVQPGQPPGRANLSISGGQLGVGREGRFTIKADAALADGSAPVTRVNNVSTLVLRMDSPRTFSRVSAINEATASGPGLPQGARLHSESTVSREAELETYEVLIKSLTGTIEKKLVQLRASNPSAKAPITGTWKFDLSDTDITPFAFGRALPPFTLGAEGRFQADHLFREVQLTGKTDLSTDQLDSVYAGLSALGRINVRTDFDIAQRSSGLRVNRLAVDIAASSPVLSAQALQALEIVPATGEIKVAAPNTDLVRISLKGLPLAWARPFAPKGLTISGDDVRGEWVARAHQGGFAMRSVSPLTIGNLSVAQAGKSLVKALDLSVAASGEYSPVGWQADVSEIEARSSGAKLLTLAVRAGQATGTDQPIKATGSFRADLPSLMAQPVAAEFSFLTRGIAQAEFTASIATTMQQISTKLALTGLRAKDGKDLPAISADLRADQHKDGHSELHAPLVFDLAGRKSDLELTANLRPDGSRWAIDAQAVSRELYVDDLKAFASLQPASAPLPPANEKKSAPGSGPAMPVPQSKPVWDAVTGRIKIAFKKVVYAAGQPPVEFATSLKIAPEMLTLESLNAGFPDGAAAKAEGVIKFQAATPDPYDVTASVTATNFDPQPFLQAANPGKPSTVEGKFDLSGKFFGRATSLDKIADTASLDAQMVSRGGRFHGFATSALAANLGKGQESVSKIASAVSILGSALGKGDVARDAEKFRAGADSIRRLIDFNFDQLNIDIAHRPGEAKTQIKNFSLISPDLRLLGSGTIDNTPGVSFLKRTLNLDLQMAARGAQADDLRILNLLKNEADALGYTSITDSFLVQGSLGSMTADSLVRMLMRR